MLGTCERFCTLVRVGYKIFQHGPVDSVWHLTTLIIVVMVNG